MGVRLKSVTFDVRDAERSARFWGSMLGRTPAPDGGGVLLPGTESQVGLKFATTPAASIDARRLHLHVTSDSRDHMAALVEQALTLGGSHLDVGQLPEEDHIVLADVGGAPFCVIGPDSSFLAGCGRLGEVACDGTRDVGVFWSAALAWPLVWDHDEETAVQAPAGGTKVAWGGPPVAPKRGRNPERFEVVAEGDAAAEVARLVGLGAVRLGERDGAVELADPDGNEFAVSST